MPGFACLPFHFLVRHVKVIMPNCCEMAQRRIDNGGFLPACTGAIDFLIPNVGGEKELNLT